MLIINPEKRIKIKEILKSEWLSDINENTKTFQKIKEFENKQNSYLEPDRLHVDEMVLNQLV